MRIRASFCPMRRAIDDMAADRAYNQRCKFGPHLASPTWEEHYGRRVARSAQASMISRRA